MPYVSLCAQKAAYLEKLLAPLNRSVKCMYGGLGGASITPGDTGEFWLVSGSARGGRQGQRQGRSVPH
jgi:hypothetical protein